MRGIFRTCRRIQYKKGITPAGVLIELDKPQGVIDKLIFVGAIARPSFPPWEALPGWERRGPRFVMVGIAGPEPFLMMEPEDAAQRLSLSIAEVAELKAEVRGWLLGG